MARYFIDYGHGVVGDGRSELLALVAETGIRGHPGEPCQRAELGELGWVVVPSLGVVARRDIQGT